MKSVIKFGFFSNFKIETDSLDFYFKELKTEFLKEKPNYTEIEFSVFGLVLTELIKKN